ncbi:MAG: phosphopentomutase [Calditrichaeota bacterium]|nr:phosphopentomutase [Calditrichota bacterium]
MRRVILIILDGVGIGYLPDADKYNDVGSNTLGHLADYVGGFNLPNLETLGLGKIASLNGMSSDVVAKASFGKMQEVSAGKDSTTGHWEIAGLQLEKPFPTYPGGFPESIIKEFEKRTGRKTIGNIAASGTEIIKQLGEEHLNTGKIIVYTSADSVFQIAVNIDLIALEELYRYCEIAREILSGEHAVARVIARPFHGKNASEFERTKDRKDFSLQPFAATIHQNIMKNGIPTVGIGKINDLYARFGIQKSVYTKTNDQGMDAILDEVNQSGPAFIMANLVDFDMLWGHRNDPDGFYQGLISFDNWLPELQKNLREEDLVMLTADHGNDPLYPGTDHTREYVPLLVFGEQFSENNNLGIRNTFADIQATIAEYMGVESTGTGISFLNQIFN